MLLQLCHRFIDSCFLINSSHVILLSMSLGFPGVDVLMGIATANAAAAGEEHSLVDVFFGNDCLCVPHEL